MVAEEVEVSGEHLQAAVAVSVGGEGVASTNQRSTITCRCHRQQQQWWPVVIGNHLQTPPTVLAAKGGGW